MLRATLLSLLAAAALATPGAAVDVRPSAAELQRAADRLVASSDVPAVVALVQVDGRRVVVASGHADLRRKVRARPRDRFWVGSITKAFVATLAMQLAAEGKLRLDDTVERWLPGRLRDGRRVRIRNLLNHTSGIPDYMGLRLFRSTIDLNPRALISPQRLIGSTARLPLSFEPGSRASYSNTNTLVLAEIVERVTGGSLDRALRTRIFRPLGLRATAYESGATRPFTGQMRGYAVGLAQPIDVTGDRLGGPWADGAIVSSAGDLARFFRSVLRGELVPKRYVRLMTTIVPGSHGEGQGLYQLRKPCGGFVYGHTGGTPGYVTFAAGSLDGRRMIVTSINGVGGDAIPAFGRFVDDLLCP